MRFRIVDLLFPPREDERIVRELTADAFVALLAPRRVQTTSPETLVLLPFSDARVRAVVHEAKYHGNERAFALLASALETYLRGAEAVHPEPAAILMPVPLGRARRRERGFNQAEEVARRAAALRGMRIDPTLLVRIRETESQVSLQRARRLENMRGAFRAPRPLDPAYLYMVLDDVMTTGATLQAAIDALRARGARRILPIALAH